MSHTPSQNGMVDSQEHDSHKVLPHQLDEAERELHAAATDPSHHHQANLERLVSDYLDRMSPATPA